ncbi:MAG: SWIM zinc finger family protein [Opitutaceae bacterium]|nr:SWIM zinc finger family protein [Opitutaceae bacterium]
MKDLRVTADGGLLARVRGGADYATVVHLDEQGKLRSGCTCPYGSACKHAVAVLLSFLDAIKAGRDVPAADTDDSRLEELQGSIGENEEDGEEENEEDGEEEGGEEASDDVEPGEGQKTMANDAIDDDLAKLTKAALLKLLRELARDSDEVRKILRDKFAARAAPVRPAALLSKWVADAKRAIRTATTAADFDDYDYGRGYGGGAGADYNPVRTRFNALLDGGHFDALLALGVDLLVAGTRQIEVTNDEGELAEEIADCMKTVFSALERSTAKTDAQKLLWEQDLRLRDEFSILDGLPGLWKKENFPAPVWSEVAAECSRRLPPVQKNKNAPERDDFERKYKRGSFVRLTADALANAGRVEEELALLRREADVVDCQTELVDRLLALGRTDEAERRCREGIAATLEKAPGIASQLEERLRDLAHKNGNGPLAAAFRAAEFFSHPGLDTYRALRDAAGPTGAWETVRKGVLGWLETGTRPDHIGNQPRASATPAASTSASGENWPLPETGLPAGWGRPSQNTFPDTSLLIRVAIEEKRNDDALTLYSRPRVILRGYGTWEAGHVALELAEAIRETHPDAAMQIWQERAEAEIAQTRPAAYETAVRLLGEIKKTCAKQGREHEWRQRLASLREKHRRKSTLMGMLDHLEGASRKILG